MHGESLLAALLVGMGGFGGLSVYVGGAFLFPRFTAALMWAEATAWLWLVRIGRKLIGSDNAGRPLRWGALVAFIAGSVMDLVGSW